MDYLRTDFPSDDVALQWFKADAAKLGMSFRAYCREYGIVIRAAEQDRRQYEVTSEDEYQKKYDGDTE